MGRKTVVNNVSVNSVSHARRCSTCLFLPCVTVSTSVGKLGHGCEGLAEARRAGTRNPASSAARVWTLPGAEAPSWALWGLPRPRTVHAGSAHSKGVCHPSPGPRQSPVPLHGAPSGVASLPCLSVQGLAQRAAVRASAGIRALGPR